MAPARHSAAVEALLSGAHEGEAAHGKRDTAISAALVEHVDAALVEHARVDERRRAVVHIQ